MTDKKNYTPWTLFVTTLKPSRRVLGVLSVTAIIVAACELSIPWMLENVVDIALSDAAAHDALNRFGFGMLGVIVVLYAVHAIYLRLEIKMTSDGGFIIRQRVYHHILSQPISYFHRKPSGELTHRASTDTDIFESNLTQILSELPFEALTIVGVIVMMGLLDTWLTIIVVTFLLITSAISAYIGRPLPVLERKAQMIGSRFSARLQEMINGIKTVKAFGQEHAELDRLNRASRQKAELEIKQGKTQSWLLPVFDLMELLGVVVVVWYGSHLVLDNKMTAGGLVAFIAYMEILAGPVSRLGDYYKRIIETYAVSKRLAEFLNDAEPRPRTVYATAHGAAPEHVTPLVFDNVTFRYPHTEQHTLRHVSFCVNENELIAIVGRNGAGKSTLVDLLQRLHAPDEGTISAGGVDLCGWNQDAWRAKLGIMTQEVFLFNASIEDNIRYSHPLASDAEIARAIEMAGLRDLISSLPKGLSTRVGEKGSLLSGGQRQRVALARLFLRNPSIVIYDEPTAALDGEAAKEVALQLLQLSRGRISFLITHQADLIRIAHRILLVDAGHLVAVGSHDELFITQPLYRLLLESMQDYQRRQPPPTPLPLREALTA